MPSDLPPPPPPGAPTGAGSGDPPEVPSDPASTGAPGPADDARFAAPRRLHPASVVLGVPVAQLVQSLFVPLFFGFAAGGRIFVGIAVLTLLLALPLRVLSWQRRLFSFDGEVLRIDAGVLSRSHRSLDVARIQQVEIQRGPLQRALGLAALRIETAGSASEPEVDLRVLTEADAVALRAAVRAGKARKEGRTSVTDPSTGEEAPPDEGREVLRVPLPHVALAATTGAQLLVLPAVIGGLFQFVGQGLGTVFERVIDEAIEAGLTEPDTEVFTGFDWRLIALVVVVVFLLTLVVAAVVGIVRDGNFRIVLRDGDLHVTRGLLTMRESVVPLRRVQLVEVQRNWLRRALGFSTVRIRSAGGSTGGDGRVTVPLLRDGEVDGLLAEVLPGTPGIPTLTAHPPAALRRALFRWLRPNAIFVAVVWLVATYAPVVGPAIDDRIPLALLALLPLAAVLAVVEYRQLAHGATDRVVAARQGALSIATTIAPVVKAQAVTTRANWFQRRLGLATVHVHVAGPGAIVEVLDAAATTAADLHRELAAHAANPVPRPLDDAAPVGAGSAGGEPGTS